MSKSQKKSVFAALLLLCIANGLLAAHATGPPANPMADPATASDPHKWLDFLGYFGEMYLLAYSLTMLIAVIDLAILRRWLPAGITFFLTIVTAVIAIAAPGVCTIIDTQVCREDTARFAYVHAIQIVAVLSWTAFSIVPFLIAKLSNQPKKFVVITIIGTVLSLIFPVAWVVAIHFAFCRTKESSPDVEPAA